ncbi:MAG TPA: STAS/SEC14 domain-containing protein [Bacteroidia bacterium]|nr:STAS/SEC14 domain-containing protein [Bacteroidia bacterium]
MLQLIKDLPDNVLGVTAEGKVTGKDYETILIPAVEDKLKRNKKVRLLYHLGTKFSEFELSAMLDDAKIGMKHLFAWEKVALVSDNHLLNASATFFGYMIPCEVRVFKNAELEEAIKWIVEN